MATKKYDLAVKTGEYQSNGKTKGRYENIGSVMTNNDGGEFLLIKRTFNPAGVPNPENKDSIIVSKFDVKEFDSAKQSAPIATAAAADEDIIPF